MARFNFTTSQELQDQLSAIGSEIETVAPKMLNEATPILRKALQNKVESDYSKAGRVIRYIRGEGKFHTYFGEYTQTGALRRGIRMSRSRKFKNGAFYARVYFSGIDEKGVSNAEKALLIEVGSSKQAPRPFIEKVVRDTEPAVLEKMQEVYNKEVGNI